MVCIDDTFDFGLPGSPLLVQVIRGLVLGVGYFRCGSCDGVRAFSIRDDPASVSPFPLFLCSILGQFGRCIYFIHLGRFGP